jgi:hypothetical protein
MKSKILKRYYLALGVTKDGCFIISLHKRALRMTTIPSHLGVDGIQTMVHSQVLLEQYFLEIQLKYLAQILLLAYTYKHDQVRSLRLCMGKMK